MDPNGPDTAATAGSAGAPLERHGAAALSRARACISARAALAVARTLSTTDPASASVVLQATLEDDVPVFEPRAAAAVPALAQRLRSSIERLRATPPADAGAYSEAVRSLSEGLLKPVCDAAVPIEARQDQAFRAAMLTVTLDDAASSYEAAFLDADLGPEELAEYRRAYGLLVDASTRQLEAVPEDARARIRATLQRISRMALPAPTPPAHPQDLDLVTGTLSTLVDDIATVAHIDTTAPEPDADTPNHLRALKRGLAVAVEAAERGDATGAIGQLRTLDASALIPASSGIAAVSPDLLAELEDDLLLRLPRAIRSQEDVAALASETDARVDDAASLVEEELSLLRDS